MYYKVVYKENVLKEIFVHLNENIVKKYNFFLRKYKKNVFQGHIIVG